MNYNVDVETIAKRLDFEVDEIKMLVDIFLDSAYDSLASLTDGISSTNYEKIFQAAHAIKGSSANLTFVDISNLAKEIELSAREEYTIDYVSKYNELKALIDHLKN